MNQEFLNWCIYVIMFVSTLLSVSLLLLFMYFWVYRVFRFLFPKYEVYRRLESIMKEDKEEFWDYIKYLKDKDK